MAGQKVWGRRKLDEGADPESDSVSVSVPAAAAVRLHVVTEDRYSDWEAALLFDGRIGQLSHRERGCRKFLKGVFIRMPGRPLAAFLHSYLLRMGFLDGMPGFDRAVARAFYYWQIGVKLRVHKRGPSR